jgi:hypothetical protein
MEFNAATVEAAVIQFYCSGGSQDTNQWLTHAQVYKRALLIEKLFP